MPEVDRRIDGGEMLPPEPPINVATPPPSGNPNWKTALIVLGSGLLSVGGGAFSNYLQTRGFVSVGAARIFLGVAWLAIAAVIVIAGMALGGQRKALTISLSLFVLTCGLGSFEAWAIISARHETPSAPVSRVPISGFRSTAVEPHSPISPPTTPHPGGPTIKLLFKETPLLTLARKSRITREISDFSYFISNLGLDVPPTPPIGIVTGTTQGTSAWVTGAPAYYSSILLGEKSLHSQDAVTQPYAVFIFQQMVLSGDLTKNTLAKLRIGLTASDYYNRSFWNYRGSSPLERWADVFWKTRERVNKGFADSLLAYTIRVMLDDHTVALGERATDGDVDNYIMQKIFTADLVVDNLNSNMPTIREIIKSSPVQIGATEAK